MTLCRKCNTENQDGLTRCTQCNAILPVKLGSKSETRFERVRRKPDLVGTDCPHCGVKNAYTRFRCESCGKLLAAKPKKSSIFDSLWVYVGLGAAIVAAIAFAMRAF